MSVLGLLAFIILVLFIFRWSKDSKEEKIDLDWFENWHENEPK